MSVCVCVHVSVCICVCICACAVPVCLCLSFTIFLTVLFNMCQHVTDVTHVSLQWVEGWLPVATWSVACSADLAPENIETSTSMPLSAHSVL